MPYAAFPVLRLPTPLHLLNMVQCWGVACLVLLLLSVVLAYMDVVVVLCLASVGCVWNPTHCKLWVNYYGGTCP
jgi:hypothetical protein